MTNSVSSSACDGRSALVVAVGMLDNGGHHDDDDDTFLDPLRNKSAEESSVGVVAARERTDDASKQPRRGSMVRRSYRNVGRDRGWLVARGSASTPNLLAT
jgi:hypothetical protein